MKQKGKWDQVNGPGTAKIRTICEVHRDIYDELVYIQDIEKKKKIVSLLEEAYSIGKKIAIKLLEHKDGNMALYKEEMKYKRNLNYSHKRKMRIERENK